MSTISFIMVVLVALIAGMASVCDERQFHRPIVACTLMGLAMGDLKTGIILGGSLELIALGWMNVGAAMAPDAALASTVATVLVIASGMSIAEGIAIAVPLAAAGQVLTIFVRTIAVFFQHQADNYAQMGRFRGVEMMHFSALLLQGLRVAIPTAIIAAAAKTTAVASFLDSIPEVITVGLQISGGFIVVVGYAMVINMMKARILMPFFFLGFVLAAFIPDLNLVGLGIIGACLALVYVQLNPMFHDRIAMPARARVGANYDNELE